MSRSISIRVSAEHAALLKEIRGRFCHPNFSSASQWLTKQVKESGLLEEKKVDEVPKKFRLRI